MKVFLVLCVIAVVAYAQEDTLSPEQRKLRLDRYIACTGKTDADKELITKARKCELTDVVIKDGKLKDFLTCMFIRTGFLSEKNELLLDVIKEKVLANVRGTDLEKVLTACYEKAKTEPKDDIALAAHKCYCSSLPDKLNVIPEVA